jgi:hypothetical protein
MSRTITIKDLIDSPPILPIWPTAGQALDLGRRTTYVTAQTGELAPGVPVLRHGCRLRVRRSDLLRYLGIDDPHASRPAEHAGQ